MEFSALSADFSSLSTDPLGSRRPAHASLKDRYPLISGYFTDIASSIMLQIDTNILLMITSTSDELFRNVNIDDLK